MWPDPLKPSVASLWQFFEYFSSVPFLHICLLLDVCVGWARGQAEFWSRPGGGAVGGWWLWRKIDSVRSWLLLASQPQTAGVFSSVELKCWMRQHTGKRWSSRTRWGVISILRLLVGLSGTLCPDLDLYTVAWCSIRFPGLDLGSVTSISGKLWVFHHSIGILLWTSPLASSR